MTTTVTAIQVANMALGHVGADRITAFDEEVEQAVQVNLYFNTARDAVLEDADWTFALDTRELTPDLTTPNFRWGQRYLIPSDILRVVAVDRNVVNSVLETYGDMSKPPSQIEWEKKGQYLFCNQDQIYVTGVQRIESAALWTSQFVIAMSYKLASLLSIPIARSKSLKQSMEALYNLSMDDATASDGRQGRTQRMRSRWLSNVR